MKASSILVLAGCCLSVFQNTQTQNAINAQIALVTGTVCWKKTGLFAPGILPPLYFWIENKRKKKFAVNPTE